MPITKLLFIIALVCAPCFATISAGTQWDVRTTGSDSNGGGYDATVTTPGTDYSQQSAAQISYTDLVIGATTTQATSVAHPFSSLHPGNVYNQTGGTGCTVGRFEVLSVSATTATFDRSLGTAASTCTGNLGGSFATIASAVTASVAGNWVWIKTGTYVFTAVISVDSPRSTLSFVGYASTHGDDGTAPLLTTATNSTRLFFMNAGGTFYLFKNLAFSSTATTKAEAIFNWSGSGTGVFDLCSFDGFSTAVTGASGSGSASWNSFSFLRSSVTNSTAQGLLISANQSIVVKDSYFYANGAAGTATPHIYITAASSQPVYLLNNIIAGGRGAGIRLQSAGQNFLFNNSIGNNAGDGIVFGGSWSTTFSLEMYGNILYGNTGYGMNQVTGSIPPSAGTYSIFNNAFGGNGNGDRYTGAPPLGTNAISLTASPWVSSTNFSLNTAVGGGALCKAAGYPGVFPGGTTTGYLDLGPVQSQGGSGTSSAFACGFSGNILPKYYTETTTQVQ